MTVRFLRPTTGLLALLAAAVPTVRAQDRTIAPGDNLVVDGLPSIPAALAADVRRYTESRGAGLVDWHPVRRELLIATRFGNTTQLHHVKAPGGDRRQVTFFDEPVGGGSFEPKAGRYILFGRDVGGNEFNQLYRYDAADGRVTLLTDGGRSQNGGTTWSTAGDRIAYGTTRRNGADRDIHVMDPATPASDRELMQVTGGGWGVTDWSPDDRQLIVIEYRSVNLSHLWLVDAATGQKTPLTPQGPDTVYYSGAAFAPDGRGIYFATDKGSEFQRLAYMDLATKAITPLTTDLTWDVESFDVSPDGRRVAFATNEAGVSKLYLLDTQTRASRPVPGVPIGLIGGLEWHTFLKNTESYRRDLRRAEYGDERDPAIAEFFERIAPLNNAGRIAKPLFVVQGGNDPRVPHTESEQMVARVKQNGTSVWYLMARDEGHGFRKKTNVDFQFYATVMFVRRFLLGEGAVGILRRD